MEWFLFIVTVISGLAAYGEDDSRKVKAYAFLFGLCLTLTVIAEVWG